MTGNFTFSQHRVMLFYYAAYQTRAHQLRLSLFTHQTRSVRTILNMLGLGWLQILARLELARLPITLYVNIKKK
jgi:hypothetical protein